MSGLQWVGDNFYVFAALWLAAIAGTVWVRARRERQRDQKGFVVAGAIASLSLLVSIGQIAQAIFGILSLGGLVWKWLS